MSDYYGSATLEDWLGEELFGVACVPCCVVDLFEEWREQIENSIESWQLSGIGWRSWGRAFPTLDTEETARWFTAEEKSKELLKALPIWLVKQGDRFYDRTGAYLMATSDAESVPVDSAGLGNVRCEVWVTDIREDLYRLGKTDTPILIWQHAGINPGLYVTQRGRGAIT